MAKVTDEIKKMVRGTPIGSHEPRGLKQSSGGTRIDAFDRRGRFLIGTASDNRRSH